jgi:hypothetical protein
MSNLIFSSLTKYFYGDHIKEDAHKGKITLGKPKRRWKNNTLVILVGETV